MDKKKKVLRNVHTIGNSQNQYVTRFALNKDIRRLLENDALLQTFSEQQNDGLVIRDYQDDVTYQSGELVWFKDSLNRIWLLRKSVNYTGMSDSAMDAVSDNPKKPNFQEHGWKNENEYIDIGDYDIDGMLRRFVKQNVIKHEEDDSVHPYGTLGSVSELDEKMMRSDMSNINPERDSTFFPYKTVRISSDGTILNGYARIWDCGLVEYDITYRFGYAGKDEDGFDVFECNNVQLSVNKNGDNAKYFNSNEDTYIFRRTDGYDVRMQDSVVKNRNDFVNAYFANIRFPKMTTVIRGSSVNVTMKDQEYMIFGSNVMSQDGNMQLGCVNPSQNQITYCDRTQEGFKAVLVTFPQYGNYGEQGYNAKNGGLMSNTFHCSVIGRWTEI